MKYIIIAPHPDDELIGCFMLFKRKLVKKVIYIVPNNGVRKREAFDFCFDIGVRSVVIETPEEITKQVIEKDCIYMVPSLQDHHPLHKTVNILGKRFRFGLYTTDMNTEYVKELHPKLSKEKHDLLNKYYPSQKSLWENDHKYFLFEGTVREV